MKQAKKNKKIKSAQESFGDIVKRIGPYIPRTPKVEKKPEPTWEPVGADAFPIPQHKAQQII